MLSPVLALYECAQLVVVVKKGWIREWLRALGWLVGREISDHSLQAAHESSGRASCPTGLMMSDGPVPFRPELTTGRLELAGRRALDVITACYWQGVRRFL